MNRIKTKISFVFIGCILVAACSNDNKAIKENSVENNQVVLIFENAPSKWKSDETNCMVLSETEYVDDNFIKHLFIPDPLKQFDTLKITTNRNTIEIKHSYRTIDDFSYLFHKGDTAIIHYNDKTPVVNVINRETKTFDLNYDLLKRKELTPNDFPAYVKFRQPMIFADYSNGFVGADEKVFNNAVKMFAVELRKEKNLLDSLKKNDLISDEISNFFKAQLLYRQKNIELQSQIGLYSIKPLYEKLSPEDFNIRIEYNQELGWINGGNILDTQNDSLLYFSYYEDIINWIYFQYLSRKVGRVKSTNYINNIATAGSNLADYLPLADTINENNFLSRHSKNMLLFKNIQNIIENYSIDESKAAFNKFKNEVTDTALINFVEDKYSLNIDTVSDFNELLLISTNNKRISYNELINNHKENVVYVDFWGSGCAPCIRQFESSATLKELYRNRNLVQVYISIESDRERWIEASEKYNLGSESYIVANKYTSRQLESMNIKYIPNYLIYDKQGKLVNEFAPRPSEKTLIELLDKYLAINE